MSPKEFRARRLELGLSVSDLARQLGITTKELTDWEHGDRPVDITFPGAVYDDFSQIRFSLPRRQGES